MRNNKEFSGKAQQKPQRGGQQRGGQQRGGQRGNKDTLFYEQAATIVKRINDHDGHVKNLVLGNPKIAEKKRMYAIVCQTLKSMHYHKVALCRCSQLEQ